MRFTGTRLESLEYRAGDDASAITALNRATILGGSIPFNEVFLAMAYARSGDRVQSELRLALAISQMSAITRNIRSSAAFVRRRNPYLLRGPGNPLSSTELASHRSWHQEPMGTVLNSSMVKSGVYKALPNAAVIFGFASWRLR